MTRVDVLSYRTAEGDVYRAIETGRGAEVVAAHEREYRKQRLLRWAAASLLALAAVGYGVLGVDRPLLGVASGLAVLGVVRYRARPKTDLVPTVVAEDVDREAAARRYELDVTPS